MLNQNEKLDMDDLENNNYYQSERNHFVPTVVKGNETSNNVKIHPGGSKSN